MAPVHIKQRQSSRAWRLYQRLFKRTRVTTTAEQEEFAVIGGNDDLIISQRSEQVTPSLTAPLQVTSTSHITQLSWSPFDLANDRNPLFTCTDESGPVMVKLASRTEAQRHQTLFNACPEAVATVIDVFSPRRVHHLKPSQRRVADRVCMAMTKYDSDAFDLLAARVNDPHELASVFLRGIRTLHMFHQATGHVHGDVKGENFVVTDDGALVLIDFEFTCKANTSIEMAVNETISRGSFIGTDLFAAPECFGENQSVVGFKADVYSWAVSFLTHISRINTDWEDHTPEQLSRGMEAELHVHITRARRCGQISRELEMVLKKCTLVNVDERYSTGEVLTWLE
eukprot:m.136138 g.136138  ORF g.136138 m.136138 type:complete len:341 (-) comp16022_c2_seq7:95-1117(-)